jgi:hypothetical protein
MKYRQREEKVVGESPYVSVKLNGDGTEALVKVKYSRVRVAKDVKTTTFGTLDLGWLTLDELACVGRTIAARLTEAQAAHQAYLDDLMTGVRRQLAI